MVKVNFCGRIKTKDRSIRTYMVLVHEYLYIAVRRETASVTFFYLNSEISTTI